MADEQKRFFNFPVTILQGFFDNKNEVFSNIVNVGIYNMSQHLKDYRDDNEFIDSGTDAERFTKTCDLMDITCRGDIEKRAAIGKSLYEANKKGIPFTGISKKMFFDFRDEEGEFENVCLLAFLALKSIIGTKPYVCANNELMLRRMAGYGKIPPELEKYRSNYYMRKIRQTLRDWGLIDYANHIRGFYFTFGDKNDYQSKLDMLAEIATNKSKIVKQRKYSDATRIARERALKKLPK